MILKILVMLAAFNGAPPSRGGPKLASLVRPSAANAKVVASLKGDAALASDLASAMRTARLSNWGDPKRYQEFARLFIANGKRWGVNPLLVACVAYVESRYKAKPPAYMKRVCGRVFIGCDKPGPCYRARWVKRCRFKRINVAEAGMMQVLWYDQSTRNGYKECTGKTLWPKTRSRKRRRAVAQERLSDPKVAVCVGTYELAMWRKWALYGGYGKIRCHKSWRRGKFCVNRLKPRKEKNVRFFVTKYPQYRRFFWVNFYNWGSNAWKGNAYARQVSWCLRGYRKHISALKAGRTGKAIRRAVP